MTEYMRKYLTNTQLTELAELPNNVGQILQLIIPQLPCNRERRLKMSHCQRELYWLPYFTSLKPRCRLADDTIITDDRLIVITDKRKENRS